MARLLSDRMCDQHGKAAGSVNVSNFRSSFSRAQSTSGPVASRRESRRRLFIEWSFLHWE